MNKKLALGLILIAIGLADAFAGFLFHLDGGQGELFGFGGGAAPHTISFNVINLPLILLGIYLIYRYR